MFGLWSASSSFLSTRQNDDLHDSCSVWCLHFEGPLTYTLSPQHSSAVELEPASSQAYCFSDSFVFNFVLVNRLSPLDLEVIRTPLRWPSSSCCHWGNLVWPVARPFRWSFTAWSGWVCSRTHIPTGCPSLAGTSCCGHKSRVRVQVRTSDLLNKHLYRKA